MRYEQRLFLLLIVLVVFPCILLCIFSINALAGQKMRIEQQIRESYTAVAGITQKTIIDHIKNKEKAISQVLRKRPWLHKNPPINILSTPLENQCFDSLYVIDERYQIIYPKERPKASAGDIFLPHLKYYNLFEKAYFYEFKKNPPDYAAAINEYQKIIESKNQKIELVGYVLLAIARCNYKGKNIDKALANYISICNIFQNTTSPPHIKLIIDAKYRIAEIYSKRNQRAKYYQTLIELLDFLIYNEYRLEKIEYKYHEEKLNKIINELENDTLLSETARYPLLVKKKKIYYKHRRLEKDETSLLIAKRYLLPQIKMMKGADYGYLEYRIGTRQYLAYYQKIFNINENFMGYVIYTVNLRYCLNEIVTPILQSQSGKDMYLSLTDPEKNIVKGKIPEQFLLVASQPLSPIFPFWRIAVYLNVKSMEEISRYHSQLYFFGLVIVILILLIGIHLTVKTFIREVKSARLKSDFLSSVTHELKTPLTSIKMFVETLLMGRAMGEEEHEECLLVISAEADRLRRLIERILNFAKMEQNKRVFHFEKGDVRALVEEAIEVFQKQIIDSTTLSIEKNIEENLPKIFLDHEAINEAILNLLSNAYKYCDRKNRKIEIICKHIPSDNTVTISVKDNGMGIVKNEQQKIFQKFYRIENVSARCIEGTGLGLSLVNSIAKAHKGKVRVQSKLGEGSEFILFLNYKSLENLQKKKKKKKKKMAKKVNLLKKFT